MFQIFPIDGGICASNGFFSDGVSAGLKKDNAPDVAFIYSDTLCNVSAIFTTNRFAAAPIAHYRQYQNGFQTNFVIVNSKCANAMTGIDGIKDIEVVCEKLKSKFPEIKNPIMSSTGVIGVRLPLEKIESSFDKFCLNNCNSFKASKAIMTTDSFNKEVAFKVVLEDGRSYSIGAIAKGAGMINPAMATMLCFITTDALLSSDEINELLKDVNEVTFDAISVDGDTSTNDTVLLLANGKSGVKDIVSFKEALKLVMQQMALDMVRDGEGAKKAVAFEISGANSYNDAVKAAKALSNSLLVKTMLFGEDPNWGRVACIIGASGALCDETKLQISFDDVLVYDRGSILMTKDVEEKAHRIMKKSEFRIKSELGMGSYSYTAFGCDLGYKYVEINADYRT